MQKGKAATSPPAMILQSRPPQQNARGPPPSQQRSDDFNPRQPQPYQMAGQMTQSLVMQQIPGPPQGQPRLPNQQAFYSNQRPMRIPRGQPPSNQPMYSSPPGGPPMAMQMIGPHGTTPFMPPGQPPQFIPPHVDFSLSMGGPAQMPYHRPQQPMQGQFAPVSGPSQPQGPYFQPTPVYQVGQPSPPMYIVRAPAGPMTGMPQYQAQTFEPRTREKKIIQIKDPNSNKDVTQEILNRQPSGSLTGSTGGTPNNITPDISGQSSSSSTPPLTSQQQAEANVRAQFAAQVAATLANTEGKPRKPEVIQKAPVNSNRTVMDAVQKESTVANKNEGVKETKLNPTTGTDTQLTEKPVEKAAETQPEEAVLKTQPKEAAQGFNLNEGVSGDPTLGSKSLVSSVNATTLAKEIISNVRVEIFTADEVRKKEAQQSSMVAVSEVKPEKKEKLEQAAKPQAAKPPATDLMPATETKTLNGPVSLTPEETEPTEEVITVLSQPSVEAPQLKANVAKTTESTEELGGFVDQQVTEPEAGKQTEEPEDLPAVSKAEDTAGIEKVNGHDGDVKIVTAAAKNPVDTQATVAAKDMKKKKQKHRLKEMEKRSSEKEMDLMEAYTEKPVQEEVPDETHEPAPKETVQAQQEEVAAEEQSEEESWEDKEESWSPELDGETEVSCPEGGKLTYERDFLLQFQSNPLCQIKPEGLPDLEVVLGQPRTPSKSGFSQNRMQKGDGGENMFLPQYIRQQSRNNQSGSRGGRKVNPQLKKVIDFPSVQPQVEQLKRIENRWVRQGELAKSGSEEEQKTEELFRKVRSILNKLTPQKFQTLTQQIIDLDIDTPERLEGAIDLIFEKAIDEAAFSVAYANMCRCLVPKKVVVEKDGVKKDISFRKILLNRCQKEFEKEKSVEKRIHEKLEHLSKEGLTEEEIVEKKKDLLDEEHLVKRRTLGNIRFIGELFKLKMLTESIMHDCVVKLLKSNDEESFECLCKLLFTIGKDLDHVKAKPRVDQYFTQISKIIQARKTSSRVRFMMQDVVDLRNNGWVPRREDNNPKTIDQIHKEAADEAKKQQIRVQMDKQQEKKMQRGNMGGRDSPRPSIPQADETWTTVGRGPRNVNVSVDPKKFQNIKRPVDSENISLGPGGKGYGAWARGSSGGSGAVGVGAGPSAAAAAAAAATEAENRPTNRYSALAGERKHSAPAKMSSGDLRRQEPRSPISGGGRRGPFSAQEREKAVEAVRTVTQPKRTQERDGGRESPRPSAEAAPSAEVAVVGSAVAAAVQELTEESMRKKSISIIEEYLNIKDMKEVAECLREVQSPSVHYIFVDVALNHTMEKRELERNATGKLLHSLLRDGVLTAQQYLQGLEQVLEYAEDIEIDIPQLWNYLGQLMGPTAFHGHVNLDELFKCVSKYVSKDKAAKLFASMLHTATNDTSREDVSATLNGYNVFLNTFFDNEEDAKIFAKEKNIEFALRQSNFTGSTSEHAARIQEELRTLILKRKARNDKVFNWIDKELSSADVKEPPFIRALVTVVCEGALEREEGGVCKCNIINLKERKPLLQKYIDDNASLEIQAVYAVQALFVQLDHPPGFVKSYFDSLYDEEIITEDSFKSWESSSDQEPGKGVTVTAASEFFRWLKSAPEETGEEN